MEIPIYKTISQLYNENIEFLLRGFYFLWLAPVKMAKRGFAGRVLPFSLHIKPICGILMEREKTERGFDITIGDKESV